MTDPFKILLGMDRMPSILNLVISTIILYAMTYALPFIVKAVTPMSRHKTDDWSTQFDLVSAFANGIILIFQIIIGAFVIWRLLMLLGGTGTYGGVMRNYIYGLAYTDALRTRSISVNPYSGAHIILSIYAKIVGNGLSCNHV